MADSFTVNDEYVEAEVYKETMVKGAPVYLVKVKFLDVGIYLTGIRVQESPKFPERGWWVQLPASYSGFRYYQVIECDGASPFLEMVTRHSSEAVDDYIGGRSKSVPTMKGGGKSGFSEPINLDDISF